MRPRILHVINNLSLGGAELLLANTVELFPEWDHTVVYLHSPDDLRDRINGMGIELICVGAHRRRTALATILKLNGIIKARRPVLVHSHLFYSTIYTRLAIPSHIPLVSTVHSVYSKDAFQKNFKSLLAARLTLKKRHTLIGVSHHVLEDYFENIRFRGKRFVVHNFLPQHSFRYVRHSAPGSGIRLVAVGNLKEAKNYLYLLEIIERLKGVSLDIYGTGHMEGELMSRIRRGNLPVRLKGSTNRIPGIFEDYDFFIQASSHEGFGLSVIEAMAAGIPVLVSDIPVFREITNNYCSFFPLDDAAQAARALEEVFRRTYPSDITNEAFEFVKNNYSPGLYRTKLLSVYEEASGKKLSKHFSPVHDEV